MKGKKIMTIILVVIGFLILVEVLALLMLKQSVASYKSYWEKGNKVINPGGQLYIALGDSAAQGVGASKPQKGYVGLIANGLATKNNQNVHTINLSVSGAKIQDVISAQVTRLSDFPVDANTVITLEIGGNDMRDFEAAEFGQKMDSLLAQMPKQTIVGDVPYFGGGRYFRLEPNVLAANKIIGDLTKKHGLKLAPLHKITQERHTIFANSADIFHPSNRGYKNWYEAFAQALGL